MKLKRLLIKNIRSYENLELNFPEGSLLLSGDIGSGKTSILLAIEYAIFGLQPGQKGSSLLRNNADSGEVSLTFEIDGNEIILERKLKRGKTVSNDYASITVNGEKTESSLTEVKTKVLKWLGYPQEFIKKTNLLYRYTVYTPQEQMKQIILEDPELRLNIIRHIFGVDRYKRIRENLEILLVYLKEKIKDLNYEIKSLDNDKNQVEQKKAHIKDLEQKMINKAQELSNSIAKTTFVEAEIKELEIKIKEKEQFEKEVEKTKIQLASKNENLLDLNREASDIVNTLIEVKEFFSEEKYIEIMKKIADNRAKLEQLNSALIDCVGKITSLENSKKENLSKKDRIFNISMCPTCLQNVPYAHKHNILNETENKIAEINKQVEFFHSERESLAENISKIKKESEALEESKLAMEILRSKTDYFEKSKRKLIDIQKQKESLEKDVYLLTQHIESLKEDIAIFSRYSNLLKKKQEEYKNELLADKHVEISLAELKKESEITSSMILDLENQIKNKEKLKQDLTSILNLNDWLANQFSTLIDFTERNVLMKIRVDFSKIFSEWFRMMVSNDNFEVRLDENFTPLIMQGEIEMDYSFLSGGERTAVALAYRLALNQTINSVLSQVKTRDIVMLDEPTEGFSETQIDKIRDVLEELNVKQLIIVSHEQKIESFVDNIIKLKKESDSSQLENLNQYPEENS